MDGSNAYELFRTDGTANGTQLTYNINQQANGNAGIQYMTPFEDKLIFTARNQEFGQELWALDNVLTQSEVVASVCDSLVLNNKTYKFSGTYLQYLTNSMGYDSLININLFVYGVPAIIRETDSLSSSWTNVSTYQWQLNGQDIAGATSRKYKPTVNGIYTVKVVFLIQKGNTCNKTSTAFDLQNVGIGNRIEQDKIEIYPNPATNIITINSKLDFLELNLEIYDLSGKLIMNKMIFKDNLTININEIQSGIYMLKIKHNDACQIHKLIIQ